MVAHLMDDASLSQLRPGAGAVTVLTMRMHMRRFTRLTNGHSKKIDNHRHAVALHYMYYNFCKVHQTLRVTPAMDAGLTDHVWSLHELVGLLANGKGRATA